MKKYSLSITVPMFRNLAQEEALDAILSHERFCAYHRTVYTDRHTDAKFEKYIIKYL